MQLLMDRNGDIKVSHALIKATAANRKSGTDVMGLLLDLEDKIVLTDDIVEVAAENEESGNDIMELLLRKETIQIADGAVAVIAKRFDLEVTRVLSNGPIDIQITEDVVKAVRKWGGKEMVVELLDKKADNFKVTEGTVQIIVQDFDEQVVRLVLGQRGADVVITEEVVKVAAGNSWSG